MLALLTRYCVFDADRKLLVMRFVEGGVWDWPAAIDAIRARNRDVRPRQPIGFAAHVARDVAAARQEGPAAQLD